MGSSDVDFFIHSYYEFKLFGVTLSINTTMVTTVIVCLILLALILFARHEIMKDYDEPNVVQNVVEMIVEKMDAMVVSNMGIHAKKYLNYVEALMAFIFFSRHAFDEPFVLDGFNHFRGVRRAQSEQFPDLPRRETAGFEQGAQRHPFV